VTIDTSHISLNAAMAIENDSSLWEDLETVNLVIDCISSEDQYVKTEVHQELSK
jgi:hypothetical protein